MKKDDRQSVSIRTAAEVWERVRTTLEYLHLVDYVLHPGHSDILTFLLFSHRWALLGWLLAAAFFFRLIHGKSTSSTEASESPKVKDDGRCKPPKPKARRKRAKRSTKSRRKPCRKN